MPIAQKLDLMGENLKPDLESANRSLFKESVKSKITENKFKFLPQCN